MEGVDIYRLIGGCALLVLAWFVQVIGLGTFRTELRNGPPQVNVVDFENGFAAGEENRTLTELAEERGWDLDADFVSVAEAERREARHRQRTTLGLLAGLGGALGTLVVAYRLWQDWLIAVACVLVGPVGIAFALRRSRADR